MSHTKLAQKFNFLCSYIHTRTYAIHEHKLVYIYTQGIGDSGQGMANVVLFVFLTPPVRKRLGRVVLFWRPVVKQPVPNKTINREYRHRSVFAPSQYQRNPWPHEKTPFMSTPEHSSNFKE